MDLGPLVPDKAYSPFLASPEHARFGEIVFQARNSCVTEASTTLLDQAASGPLARG